MQDQIDPRVVSKIQKLLALANDGGATENEARVAMSKAQDLMAEYNLTLAALEAQGGEKEARTRLQHEKNLMFVWKRELLDGIAKTNFCVVILQHGTTKSGEKIAKGYDLIGRQSNIVATRNMFHYLLQTIERLIINEFRTNSSDRGSRRAHSFRLGASERLRDRLKRDFEDRLERQEKEAKERQSPQGSTSNALVIVLRDFKRDEDDANEDVARGFKIGTTAARRAEGEARYEQAKEERRKRAEAIMAEDATTSEEVAFYMSCGYTREQAEKVASPKPETDAQRRKREGQSARYWDRQRRKQDNQNRKIDGASYLKGNQAADTVGLDQQIDKNSQKLI